jgi:hypothetical protein
MVVIDDGLHRPTLCDKFCQLLATGRWFSPGTPISSTNKTNCHDIAEMLLKVELHLIHQEKPMYASSSRKCSVCSDWSHNMNARDYLFLIGQVQTKTYNSDATT